MTNIIENMDKAIELLKEGKSVLISEVQYAKLYQNDVIVMLEDDTPTLARIMGQYSFEDFIWKFKSAVLRYK